MNRNLQLAAALAITLAAGAAAAFNPDAAWISHVQDPSLRPADGCPASFISRDGLVLASRQCVSGCIRSLSTAGTDYARDGFYAAARSEERQCPAMELDRLERIIDVTARMQGATRGLDGEALGRAQRTEQERIESGCVGGDDTLRCEVVRLHQGGIYNLYRYRRYQDVRLVLAPEAGAAPPCGTGLVDFPCHPPGMSLLRVYVDGKPGAGAGMAAIRSRWRAGRWMASVPRHPDQPERSHGQAQAGRRRGVDLIPGAAGGMAFGPSRLFSGVLGSGAPQVRPGGCAWKGWFDRSLRACSQLPWHSRPPPRPTTRQVATRPLPSRCSA